MASPQTDDQTGDDMVEKMAALLREQRESHPAAFEKALDRTAKLIGRTPDEVRGLVDNPTPFKPPALTPAELVAMRPDIAAMQAQLPKPGPSSVDMQAAAQQETDTRPYMTYSGQRFYLKHDPDAFDLADLAEFMENAEQAPILALGGINRLLRSWLADYPALRAAFRKELDGKDLDAQMTAYGAVAASLWESTAARPTAAPAGSSDGRGPTTTSSKDVSPSPAGSPSTGPSGSPTSIPG